MAGLGTLADSDGMTLISPYPLGQCLQALLAAMVCPPQPPLTETKSVPPKPVEELDDDLDYFTAD